MSILEPRRVAQKRADLARSVRTARAVQKTCGLTERPECTILNEESEVRATGRRDVRE